jgi:murein DD-endopeptidase MepM/ murein hydrolase activator NlpD
MNRHLRRLTFVITACYHRSALPICAEDCFVKRIFLFFLLLVALSPQAALARQAGSLGVQETLEAQTGVLQHYSDGGRSVATIIESNSLYYGISPRLHLAMLETTASLLSEPNPTEALLRQPFSPAGPDGFAAQIEWLSRELRAGLGPYSKAPTLRFNDGVTLTIQLDQAPESIAVQRFLAKGRASHEWRAAVERFAQIFAVYFNNELPEILAPIPGGISVPQGSFTLHKPWPDGTRVVHLAYFDHVYPTVDSGPDGNTYVVNYLGQGNVQYNGHDGHDYYFPDMPIGTPMLAAAAGTAYARTHRGNGVVIVHPGGYETVYWHLDSFAPIFDGRIDSNDGIWVETGTVLGTSGTSGFVRGTPHLHFEVRHFGRQVDPYGWYGGGQDPCAEYVGCAASTWLWDASLVGQYDFTPPDQTPLPPVTVDTNPPIGTLAINPDRALLLYVGFDGHPLQEVGAGFPEMSGTPRYVSGRIGQALQLDDAGLAYPTAGNLSAAAGSISLWALLPEQFPRNSIDRHYLLASSANADGAPHYTNTLSLRRDRRGPDGAAQWTFWTSGPDGAASWHELSVPDTLAAGWHHFAISWDTTNGWKALYIDGDLVAEAQGLPMPNSVGPVVQIGRFSYGGAQAGVQFDDLSMYRRPLSHERIAELANGAAVEASAHTITTRLLRLDTNAIDSEGGIVAVQLGRDGTFEDPQPYYDSYRWQLPDEERTYELGVRYFDRAGNSTTITQSVSLKLAPRATVTLDGGGPLGVTVVISATDSHVPIEIQLSSEQDFAGAQWQPLQERFFWMWKPGSGQQLYLRLRDSEGMVSATLRVARPGSEIYLPMIRR